MQFSLSRKNPIPSATFSNRNFCSPKGYHIFLGSVWNRDVPGLERHSCSPRRQSQTLNLASPLGVCSRAAFAAQAHLHAKPLPNLGQAGIQSVALNGMPRLPAE